ncbi:EVE domain-containing protein [Bacterioplanes sanyensis]|uniref:EVE domain-containing protein n=1 Tax=Bacterioplanes sanyensis TaxID=1249553 RepID=A0A222FFA4_9GAMM|nr:EVE domain-containing protein [Bacterioplanes sanyensis]ASP37765.1 EVE domain-containing protein [Bacterioplanes sanyensis]
MHYWLFKSEPDEFSFQDLLHCDERRTVWDGVRNYQARNLMRDHMAVDDLAFFYHSSCKQPAIVGICRISATKVPDPSAFDTSSPYFDPKSDPSNPRWLTVEVCALEALSRPVTLKEMRQLEALADMTLLNNPRLSVQPVEASHWQCIVQRAET